MTVIGVGADGQRCLLGLDAIDAKFYANQLAFLRSLRKCRVRVVLCVISNAHEVLRRATEDESRMTAACRATGEEHRLLHAQPSEEACDGGRSARGRRRA